MIRLARQAVFALVILVTGAACFWIGYDARGPQAAATTGNAEEADASNDASAAVRVDAAIEGTIRPTLTAYGTIQPAAGSTTVLTAPFDSIVARVLVRIGQHVDAGVSLGELTPSPDAMLQLQQARDALTAATRNLADVRQRLEQQLATNVDLATAEQAQRAAQTQLDNLQARGIGSTATLKASSAGTVSAIAVQTGQAASAGTSLMSIDAEQPLEAIVGVDPADVGSLAEDAPVALRPPGAAGSDDRLAGHITLIAPAIDPQSRLRLISVELPSNGRWVRGDFVVAELPKKPETGLIVPRSAVLPDEDDQILFTVDHEHAVRHVVTIVARNQAQLLVNADGLAPGSLVVVEGNAELEDGMAVRPDESSSSRPATTEDAKGDR